MIKKSFPIKEPFLYDTKRGIDYFTQELLIDQNHKKLSDKEKQEIHKLGRDMKKAALDNHIRTVKPMDNLDPKSYLSDPLQRGKILEIDKLKKDLAPKLADLPIVRDNINKKPVKRNYWDATMELNVGNKGPMKLPKLTPEEIKRANEPNTWDVIYESMSPIEKGQWNAEKRKEKEQRKKEEDEDKAAAKLTPVRMARDVVDHINTSTTVNRDFKSDNYYPGAISTEDSISHMPVRHALRPKEPETGLSKEFTRNKLAEGKLLKDVLGE